MKRHSDFLFFSARNLALCMLPIALCIGPPARAAENYFIVWGPMFHEDQTLCAHRPQDPHFALPNQVSYVAHVQGHPEIVVTERSPKWNIRDDATIPGNGYYGVEVGNLRQAWDSHPDTLVVTLTCEGTGEQTTAAVPLRELELGHQQFDLKLQHEDLPRRPGQIRVTRQKDRNVLRWSRLPGVTYDLYRSDLTDTLADGRPKRIYRRITRNLNRNTFIDPTIDPAGHYGYVLIPRTPQGLTGAHSMEGVDIPLEQTPMAHIALFSSGNMAISRAGRATISIVNPGGDTVATVEASPRSVHTVDRRDNLWVVDSTGVKVYSPRGILMEIRSLPRDVGLEGEIRDTELDRRGRLWLLTGNGLYAFDRDFNPWVRRRFEPRSHTRPTSISLFRGRIAITDPVAETVRLYRFRRGTIRPTGSFSTGPLEPWDVRWIRMNTLAVSDPFKNTVSLYDPGGEHEGSLNTDPVGSLESPRDMQSDRHTLYVADRHRIVVIPTRMDMSRLSPRITFDPPGKATLSWRSAVPTPTAIRYWPEGDKPRVERDPRPARRHRISLENLPPVSRINYAVPSPLRTIPPRAWSQPSDFATPLWERGKTAVLRLPLAVILHTHAVDLSEQPENHPPTVPIPSDQVDLIRKQIDDAVLFYWHNSAMKVYLDVDFFTSDRFLDVAPFGEHPPPNPENIETFLDPKGHHLSDYVGVVRIIAEQRFDPDLNAWVIAGRGGGFTWGINPIDRLPGASWWRATPPIEGSGNDWLMTHEFHHQLDAAFHESDHPEYPFNHFSPMEYTGPFGEHYDGNAFILREWRNRDWFLLKWGEARVVVDRDEDGIPDEDPRLPSDEKRLGSDPASRDSDGDGLEDLEEVLLSNWVTFGVGEDWGEPVHLPDLTRPDTDGDGQSDGEDPYPLYDLHPAVPHSSPDVDGNLRNGEWSPFFHLRDERGQGDFFLAWDRNFLYGAARIAPAAPFHLQIDATTNGWFDGRDNLVFRFTPGQEGPKPKVEARVFVCDEQPDRYPYMNTDLIPVDSIRTASSVTGEEWSLEFAIPRLPDLGLTLERNQQIGINAGCYFDSSLRRRVSLFEPHRLIILTLRR